MKFFKKVDSPTEFQKRIADMLNANIYMLDNPMIDDFQNSIPFIPNYVYASAVKYKAAKYGSLQRKVQNSLLYDLRRLVDKKNKVIDIAGGRHRGLFGIRTDNFHVLNIVDVEGIKYKEDIEADCFSVPRDYYDTALCFNYMLLSKNPEKVIENICSFLKKGGISIIGFQSLSSWYLARGEWQWSSFNPHFIAKIIKPHFSDYVIVPVGNFIQALANYYSKKHRKNKILAFLLKRAGLFFGKWDRSPFSATEYVVVAIK